MTRLVLDTSAVLAAFLREPGADVVRERGAGGIISSVNVSETLAKLSDRDVPIEEAAHYLKTLNLHVVPFDQVDAVAAARLQAVTRRLKLSFADRACLATGVTLQLPVLTGDRNWAKAALDVEVQVFR